MEIIEVNIQLYNINFSHRSEFNLPSHNFAISEFCSTINLTCLHVLSKFSPLLQINKSDFFPPIQIYGHGIELACQKQKEFVKSSVECKWNLAEAQQKLGSLALHNSESLDQEHAKAQTDALELRQREEEWRQKEEALIQRETQNLWNADSVSKDVFNKVRTISTCIKPGKNE